jgi:hypothetical protein
MGLQGCPQPRIKRKLLNCIIEANPEKEVLDSNPWQGVSQNPYD